ncbi:MAG: type II 3-dehydroquinate dehydratase [Oscillospiraceae bacterium]|nr:type II 3-dehydroquinate dehydratase [Oscillospiraceae bacterium]MBQ4539045.1 type II 3-dehydroquinate dehydratase [Oscillospiraceae bacterium]
MKLLVINGPNINMLGIREKNIYGSESFQGLIDLVENTCHENGITVECYQSNHEGEIVDKIQAAYQRFDGIVINGGAYTHTSIAILDALKAVQIPAVEVHISDIFKRESFRHISYLGMACEKAFIGLGLDGYRQAILYLNEKYGK